MLGSNNRDDNTLKDLSFYEALSNGNYPIVQQYIESGMVDLNGYCDSGDFAGFTPLGISILQSNLDIVNLLLENKVDVNKTSKGRSPLHIAIVKDRLDIVQILLKKGADVNILDHKQRSPLTYGIQILHNSRHQNLWQTLEPYNVSITAGKMKERNDRRLDNDTAELLLMLLMFIVACGGFACVTPQALFLLQGLLIGLVILGALCLVLASFQPDKDENTAIYSARKCKSPILEILQNHNCLYSKSNLTTPLEKTDNDSTVQPVATRARDHLPREEASIPIVSMESIVSSSSTRKNWFLPSCVQGPLSFLKTRKDIACSHVSSTLR